MSRGRTKDLDRWHFRVTELAASGRFQTIWDIESELRREGCDIVDRLLAPSWFREDIYMLIAASAEKNSSR